ncbi:hypothetical protein B0J11DRAFT_36568 [Dendryphion nanum]|uniref:ADF-H domain-containing protein n=1 Tax=Dendryphion nanum TaxID=256645 RepID=A0A9P9EGL9_9PLEO|nr:hypothetical protein B0J11DRAFT_36568 [Dendryphion nanum]
MSLNGLDDQKVTEAYQGALAEGGGWFLLKYASRDAVDVLARGTGGAADARSAVAQYEEKSPLYGFLLYRRRKVLIKYVPDGTSRLLQARVAVHFTAVSDKFTPHDTVISIASADELSDSALASACSLHTAVPSNCSSTSSSRRKLDEITEDAEEGQNAEDSSDDTISLARPATSSSSKATVTDTLERVTTTDTAKTSASHVTVDAAPEDSEPEFKSSNFRDSLKEYDSLFANGPDPRMSSQTARPAMSDLYAEIYAQYKPKVKLGPRPRPSLDTKRPHTSGPGAQNPSRPVSSLPAGMRVANRKNPEPKRPKSRDTRDTTQVPSIAFPPLPPVPPIPDLPLPSPSFAPKSPASVKSLPLHIHPRISPEKQRLMKALELRKRQLKARQGEKEKADQLPGETAAESNDHAETVDGTIGSVDDHLDDNTPTAESAESQVPAESVVSENPAASDEVALNEHSSLDMAGSQAESDDLHSAVSACSPTSAQTQGSSCAPSTRPSSVSEDGKAALEQDDKTEAFSDVVTKNIEIALEPPYILDEDDSIESSPTVVPDNDTPVPSVEVTIQSESQSAFNPQASASDTILARKNKRESMILMPPDIQSGRRSKRESMIFMPSDVNLSEAEATSKREKRESMIFAASNRQSYVESKERRRAMLDPLHLSAENSDCEYLSDDSFMEELQSATLEEAKPMSVSKSPITPFFPRKTSVSEISVSERSVSHSYKGGRFSSEQQTPRKASGPWLPHANSDTAVVAKKINVSSGISQRIKALAEKSNRESSASVSLAATPDSSHSIVQRKSSFFSTPPSGNSPNTQSIKRLSRASFANLSSFSTPDKKPILQPPPSRGSSREGPPVYKVQPAFQKPESVQVTARIVRDGRMQKPALTMPTETTPLDLHQSQITIDHKRSAQTTPKSPIKLKMEPSSPRPASSSQAKEPNLPRSSSESSWRSFGRRLSESRTETKGPRSLSAHSFESTEERRDEKKEKKDSRTSKLFKRMSSISAISRKTGTISSMQGEDGPTSLPSLREPPPAVQVGDLNVQFPDTLLWKRRWVEIDATGNLVLSLSKSNEQSKGITKRFHLSEFRTPYAPDQDRQELPNSVILDFIDGRTLQCACETYMAQAQVLQILREAHDAWIAYNQGA